MHGSRAHVIERDHAADASGRNTQLRPHVATPCPASSDHDRAAVQAETSTARCFRHRIRPTKPVATAVIA